MQCCIILNPKKYSINRKKDPADVLARNFALLIGSGNGCDELGEGYDPDAEDRLEVLLESIQDKPDWRRKIDIALKVIHGIE